MTDEVFKILIKERPIAYMPPIAKAFGSIKLAVLWSQIYYWSDKTKDPDGWVYKSMPDIFEETALSRKELDTARRDGAKLGVLESQPMGPKNIVHYRIDFEKSKEILEKYFAEHPRGEKIQKKKTEESDGTGKRMNDMIDLFKSVNPTHYRIFANINQRAALKRMVGRFGFEKIEELIKALPQLVDKKFAPKIMTPMELEAKMGKLEIFVKNELKKNNDEFYEMRKYDKNAQPSIFAKQLSALMPSFTPMERSRIQEEVAAEQRKS